MSRTGCLALVSALFLSSMLSSGFEGVQKALCTIFAVIPFAQTAWLMAAESSSLAHRFCVRADATPVSPHTHMCSRSKPLSAAFCMLAGVSLCATAKRKFRYRSSFQRSCTCVRQRVCRKVAANKPVVLLLQPSGACSEFTRSGSKYPPLGLCQLAATVPASDVHVLDADGLSLGFEETLQEIERLDPVAVGMTVTTYTFDMVNKYIKPVKERGRQVLLGGPQVTLDAQGTLEKCSLADWVFKGEAEMIFPEVVKRLAKGETLNDLPGVSWREPNGKLVISSESPMVPDLDLLPLPRFDGLPMSSYWCPDAKRLPMLNMMTVRGCPHRCGFCSSPKLYGRKLRAWSVPTILDAIEEYVSKFGIKEISFVDDVFTIDKRRMRELCEGIIERGLDITWFCNSRADQITDELAELAAQAGCHQMYLGFESGDQQVLEIIKKDTTIEKLERGAAALKKNGVNLSVGFVVGLPGETEQGVDLSIEMAKRVQPERLQFTRWTPLVGSPLYTGIHGDGFHSSISDKTTSELDEVDLRVQRMYKECGKGTMYGSPARQSTNAQSSAAEAPPVPSPRGIEKRIFNPPPEAFADIFPDIDITAGKLNVVVVAVQMSTSMAVFTRKAQKEREEQLNFLVTRANAFRAKVLETNSDVFCDFIDPRSGHPAYSPPKQVLYHADARYEKHLGFRITELGCCRVLMHHEFGACVLVGVVFCTAPASLVHSCLDAWD